MGRVTVFSISDCPFCQKAKSFLSEKHIEYYEINIQNYPMKRVDMVKLSKSFTVPQIFFNDYHVGGASDLVALSPEKLEELVSQVNSSGDPVNIEAFTRPDVPPVEPPKPSPRKVESIKLNGQETSFIELTKKLRCSFGSNALSKSQLESFLQSQKAEEGAFETIVNLGVITSTTKSSYKLTQETRPPQVLNNFRIWNDRVDPPLVVLKLLKKKLNTLVSKYRDGEGLVNYAKAREDPLYDEFQEAACEVQKIKLAELNPDARLAFGINLYNIMIIHAFLQVGAPSSNLQRNSFFSGVSYDIGGDLYSFSELENGILRGNKPSPPFYLKTPIGTRDPRASAVLTMDNLFLIHFALNCGAKSCPPIKVFSEEAIHEELDVVARAFLEQENNCSINVNTGVITVSKILQWYASDFGPNNKQVVKTIQPYLSEERAALVQNVLDRDTFQLKYFTYDWSNDAKETIAFQGSSCVIC